MDAPTELSLFSGAGGGLLASRWLLGWRTVCYVEREPYCVRVLKQRIADGYLDDAPIWDDAATFDGRPWAGLVDVVTAGFPCQPFSVAGKGRAADDERNGWPHTARILGEVRPRVALLENVPGLLSGSHGYFGQVLGDLASLGYDAVWDCIPASALGAPHRRDRLWIVADAPSDRRQQGRAGARPGLGQPSGGSDPLADADGGRREGERERRLLDRERPTQRNDADGRRDDVADASRDLRAGEEETRPERQRARPCGSAVGPWPPEPPVGRVVDGMAHRVGQLRALGNGQVPRVVAAAWRLLSG